MSVKPDMTRVEIFCDGACSGNPGPGGYGAILRCGGREKEISGWAPDTTNNRMELTAVIEALRQLTRPCLITITTDSQYVVKGMTEWIAGWKRNGWRNSKKEAVLNRDLWEALLAEVESRDVTWHKVPGHAGVPLNERADRLAAEAIQRMLAGVSRPAR